MRPETERWLRYSGEDLVTARVTFAGNRWAATSFYAHLAAEKALKAIWVEGKALAPPRTHDLVRLAEELGLPADWLDELDALSRVYLVSRYPEASADEALPYGIDEPAAQGHLLVAERVVAWAQQRLSTASSSG